MNRTILFVLAISFAGLFAGVIAAEETKGEESFEEDFDGDFVEDSAFDLKEGDFALDGELAEAEKELVEEKSYTYNGSFSQKTAYSYQHEDADITLMRSELNLELTAAPPQSSWKTKINWTGSYDLAYRLEGRDDFNRETLDAYETDSELNELYLDIDFTSWLNLRAGRQFFSWGETAIKQISDIGNPRDFRELGLQDLDEVRLSAAASKLTFYGNDWEYNMIAIHEIRPDEFGTEGSEFDPYLAVRNAQVIIEDDEEPASSLKNTEFLTRLFLSGHLGDINLYWSRIFEDSPVLDLADVNLQTGQVRFTPRYKRIHAYGLFGNFVAGNFLLKYDLARKTELPLMRSTNNIFTQINSDPFNVQSFETKNVRQWMLGFDYSGIDETSVVFEYSGQYIEDHHPDLANEKINHEVSLYISHDMLHDTLVSTFWWSHDLKEHANLYKIESAYAYTDELKFTAGFSGFIVHNENNFYYPYRNNDRIYLSVQYDF